MVTESHRAELQTSPVEVVILVPRDQVGFDLPWNYSMYI
jgi:hypothetical protein